MKCSKCGKEISIEAFYDYAKSNSCFNMLPSEFEDVGYELEIGTVLCPFCEDEDHNFVEDLTDTEFILVEDSYREELEEVD